MSPRKSRNLWCFLQGPQIAGTSHTNLKPHHVVNIPIKANVCHLRGLIQQAIQRLHTVDPDELQLWKLDVAVPIDPDHSLAQRLADLDAIATFSSELSSGEEVGLLFPEPPSQRCLHIVVKCPDVVLSSASASRKHLRSKTDEDGRATKRKDIGRGVDIQTYYKAIKKMPDINLSDPSTFTDLPYPSLLAMPFQRFGDNTIDGISHFKFMGRSQFCELQRRIENTSFLKGSETLYLYGSAGAGKSHLLAALTYHLVREGKRVFFIPDCYKLLLDPLVTMQDAYDFAYHDPLDPGTIEHFDNVDELVCSLKHDRDVYIIVDQMNALELVDNNGDRGNEMRIQITSWLNLLRARHRFIFSASANEDSNREASNKQHGITVIPAFGGLNLDETKQWFIQHRDQIPHLSPEQRQQVEYLTGGIPLLLMCLTKIANYDELEFRKIPDLAHLASDVCTFAKNKLATLNTLHKEIYLNIMTACVRGDRVTLNDQSLYDLRHFYVDTEGIGRFTCGIAFEAMMSILRTYGSAPFLDEL